MIDPRVEKLADVLVNYCTDVKKGQQVLIQGEMNAQPLLMAIYRKVLENGAHPFMLPIFDGQLYTFLKYASDGQIAFISEPYRYFFEKFDTRFRIVSDSNPKELTNIDPEKMIVHAKAYGELMNTMLERAAKGEYHWTVAIYPSSAHAMEANMSLEEYENFVYSACLPDMEDPIGHWKKVSAYQAKLIRWLEGRKTIHVVGKETDLRMRIDGRPFINCDGKENMPDGEIFTSPIEDSMEGYVNYSYPAIYNGREVSGIRLWFEKGKVVKATADKNEDFLIKTLDTDEGARYVGEWAIGTNYAIDRFTGEILFDEKIGGSFHCAVGTGFPESGSHNRSDIHWDMICDMRDGGEIWVDDILFYKDGKFVIEVE